MTTDSPGDSSERGSRHRFGWPARIVVILLCLPFLYVLSFGPACWWIASRGIVIDMTGASHTVIGAPRFYWPMGALVKASDSKALNAVLFRLADPRRGDTCITFTTDDAGNEVIIVP